MSPENNTYPSAPGTAVAVCSGIIIRQAGWYRCRYNSFSDYMYIAAKLPLRQGIMFDQSIPSMKFAKLPKIMPKVSYRLGDILAAWFSVMCVMVRPLSKGSGWMDIKLEPDDLQEDTEEQMNEGIEIAEGNFSGV